MKYVIEQGKVWLLVANWHPFKGVENYFTEFVLYQGSLEIGLDIEQPDSKNKANEEL